MRRRTLLGGIAGLAGIGGGAWYLSDWNDDATGAGIDSIEVEPLWAPAESDQSVVVPERGRVTHLEFFATWCNICSSKMPDLVTYHDSLAGTDVQLLSTTFEPVGTTVPPSDVRQWWREDHNGQWPVFHDEDYYFTRELGITQVPTTVVLDANNRVQYNEPGTHTVEELHSMIESASQ